MAINGNISTMSLTDLLRWAHGNRKQGVLELERNKIRKQILFEQGRIASCSTQDPTLLLGQFLISRGKITPAQLKECLAMQEESGQTLGIILPELGLMTTEELDDECRAKVEESLYGLFDWTEAVFRFNEFVDIEGHAIAIDLEVEEVIEKGTLRRQELERIRGVFTHSAIVLQQTDQQTPAKIRTSGMASRILDTIDGERSIAEILLHAHATEYLVLRFLFTLFQRNVVSIREEYEGTRGNTLLDSPEPAVDCPAVDPVAEEPIVNPEVADVVDDQEPIDIDIQFSTPEELLSGVTSVETPVEPPSEAPHVSELGSRIRLYEQLVERGEYYGALDIISDCYRRHPGDSYLRHLVLQAESSFLKDARQGTLELTRVPVAIISPEQASEAIQPSERFLMGMLDGKNNIKSILWTAPLRELDLFRALYQLLVKGMIELRDADGANEGIRPAAVLWV
ncbi:MAG: DUF4388 domain-containing protein [Acidobacteriota bacterium]|nr:DUF4388 domain-containing protein [Acidobacteriota bacterium]MDH3785043.1 DUF4388 domain-containing protein [Acidobacteriota bacterium]